MSLIIRLQGLPAVADSFDIRQFFCGLNIPRGGVYITGGKYGEAYIVFATYEDARYALSLSGRLLKDSYVHLTYSNEEEMRRALEIYQIGLKPSTSASSNSDVNPRGPEKKFLATFSYIYIHGMSTKATKVEIREFFRGLLVEDVLFLKFINGVRNGNAIVKFGRSADASEGLKLNNMPICGSQVALKLSNEVEWTKNGGELVSKRKRSPQRSSSYERRRSRSRSPRRRTRRISPYVRDYYVHLINLSYRAEKNEIKRLFYDYDMKDSQITFLVDKEGNRTREGFVMFTTEKGYKRAICLNGEDFKGRTITILPISKKDMLQFIQRMSVRICKDKQTRRKSPSRQERKYIYMRNFAFDVTVADVQKFFSGQTVKEEDVYLLHDDKGIGLGEALVKFTDDKEASNAEKVNHQTFLGIKILLSRITEEQMKALKKANEDIPIVTEADDAPDFTSEPLPNPVSSVKEPPVETNGETALDSNEVGMCCDSESVPPLNKESEDTFGSDIATPLIENDPAEEFLDNENCCDEEMAYEGDETKNSEVTLLFIRNLPASVTVAEILDLFLDYKVSSVNLKNIEKGIATVRMLNYAEAVAAINALNKKEVGHKQVFLSLF
ncbi:RNA-binding protein 12B-like [Rhinoderma darwinii]|uniref:RNA-binding protein 12B-like n=1 Tax=Rhinoderma darwinii TaxID=43563 RepID=UPI003F673A72